MTTTAEFWTIADETRLDTEYKIDDKINFLKSVSLETLQQICLQYRYFTAQFPDNLGVLISKLPQGNFKSLLGEILNEELGEGNPNAAHIRLYDNFLLSIGIDESELSKSLHPENEPLLEQIRQLTLTQTAAYGIGLVGMGGECLCQIYLSNMYENLTKNPLLQMREKEIDWTFWTFHAGEADVIHRRLVRQAINEVIEDDPALVDYLAEGYMKAKNNWDLFWENNYKFSMRKQLSIMS